MCAANIAFEFQWAVVALVANDSVWNEDGTPVDWNSLRTLRQTAERMELALKDDLGLVAAELQDNRRIESYGEIEQPPPPGLTVVTR